MLLTAITNHNCYCIITCNRNISQHNFGVGVIEFMLSLNYSDSDKRALEHRQDNFLMKNCFCSACIKKHGQIQCSLGERWVDDNVDEALSLLHDRTSSEQRATKDYTFVQASQRIWLCTVFSHLFCLLWMTMTSK